MSDKQACDYWHNEYLKLTLRVSGLEAELKRVREEHRKEIQDMEREMGEAIREAAIVARYKEREDLGYGGY